MSPLYVGVGGVVHELTEMHTGINGVVTPLTEMWAGVDGVNRQIFGGSMFSDLIYLGKANKEGSGFLAKWVFSFSAPSSGWGKFVIIYGDDANCATGSAMVMGANGEVILGSSYVEIDHAETTIDENSIKFSISLANYNSAPHGYAAFFS